VRRGEQGIVDIFFASFAHRPLWMMLLLIVRNKLASLAGLDAPTASELRHVEIKKHYAVGDQIGSGLEGPVLAAPARQPEPAHATDGIA